MDEANPSPTTEGPTQESVRETGKASDSRRSLKKHHAILNAGVEEFQATGFDGTSMDRIAARAGVSKRTVYNHFASKEALFREIFEVLLDQVMRASEQLYDPATPVREQLIAIGRREVALFTSEDFAKLARVTLSTLARDPEVGREVFDSPNLPQPGLVRWIEAALSDGALDDCDTETAACQFSALIKAFALWPQILCGEPVPTGSDAEAIVESAVDMFLARYQRTLER